MEKLKKINELKHKLIDSVEAEFAKGIKEVDAEEMGEVIDMIKDLAEAEKACMEACYYETVTEAMTEGEGRYGYDRWRYSSGRFAPKGRGHVSGYEDGRMGYDGDTTNGTTNRSMTSGTRTGTTSGGRVYGYDRMMPFDGMNHPMMGRYGYGDPKEQLEDAMESMRDVWEDADHSTKEKVKHFFNEMLEQMED